VEPETQQWYGGVLVTGTRTLTPEERDGLAEMRKETIGDLWRAAAFILFVLVLICGAFLLGSGLLAVLVLLAASWRSSARVQELTAKLQFVRGSRRDLTDGLVAVCEHLEVLATSGMVWKYKGTRQHTITLLTRASTAAMPEHARLAMQYVKPFDDKVSVHQRPLSEAELHELAGYAPGLPLLRGAFGALTIAAAVVALSAVPRYIPVVAASLAICLFITWRIGRALAAIVRTRRNVLRDAAERYVVIVRRTEDNQLFEVLPHSHYVWSEGGEPADWRRS
jgi:hypothetical protein